VTSGLDAIRATEKELSTDERDYYEELQSAALNPASHLQQIRLWVLNLI